MKKEEIIKALKENKNHEDAAKSLGISRRTLYTYRKKYELDEISFEKNKQIDILFKDRLNDANKEIERLKKDLALKQEEIDGIFEIKNSIDLKGLKTPEWLDFNSMNSKQRKLSIPTLMCSDEHWGEYVNPAQINNMNEYNTEIARKRYNNIINNFLDITNNHLNNVDRERMVLVLGGDNISGDIHGELALTNDCTTMEAVYDYVEHKVRGIRALLNAGYKQIFIPCVSGNHDRNTHKIHHKNRLETSFAFIVYKFLQKIFADDKRVIFSIAKGQDCLYKVHNHKMLLTHGDCFKGGNGIGGITVPILRGMHKKLASYNAMGDAFDSMIIGHFHQFTSINNGQVIINGTLKGFDEYSMAMGFGYQAPSQAFWLTHPDRGITIQLPIYATDKKEIEENKTNWISWKE